MWRGMFTCECGKRAYATRRQAKQAARDFHPGEHLSVYRCDRTGTYHVGHLPMRVLRGRDDRGHHYGRRGEAS